MPNSSGWAACGCLHTGGRADSGRKRSTAPTTRLRTQPHKSMHRHPAMCLPRFFYRVPSKGDSRFCCRSEGEPSAQDVASARTGRPGSGVSEACAHSEGATSLVSGPVTARLHGGTAAMAARPECVLLEAGVAHTTPPAAAHKGKGDAGKKVFQERMTISQRGVA